MKIIKVQPQGYCGGVIHAINIVKELRKNNPDTPIYIWGLLVHNEYVMQALKLINVITLLQTDDKIASCLQNLPKGYVVTTAHGTTSNIINQIKKHGFIHVDATCSFVASVQEMIKKDLKKDYDIIYYGIENHPEVKSILALNHEHIHPIYSTHDIDQLSIDNPQLVAYTQTTVQQVKVWQIFEKLKAKYPQILLHNEICPATFQRQEKLRQVMGLADVVIIVGDVHSNNTNSLVQLVASYHLPYFLVAMSKDLDIKSLQKYQTLVLISGTSTPLSIVNNIEKSLKKGEVIPLNYAAIL